MNSLRILFSITLLFFFLSGCQGNAPDRGDTGGVADSEVDTYRDTDTYEEPGVDTSETYWWDTWDRETYEDDTWDRDTWEYDTWDTHGRDTYDWDTWEYDTRDTRERDTYGRDTWNHDTYDDWDTWEYDTHDDWDHETYDYDTRDHETYDYDTRDRETYDYDVDVGEDSSDVDHDRVCSEEEIEDTTACYEECQEIDSCWYDCLDEFASPECRRAFSALNICSTRNGCNSDFWCLRERCAEEYAAVYGGSGGDSSIQSPYGEVEISFSTPYIRDDTDDMDETEGILWDAFAHGVYGRSNVPIVHDQASFFQSYAYYYYSGEGNVIQINQVLYNNSAFLNPMVVMVLQEPFETGPVEFGVGNDFGGQFYLVDLDDLTGEVTCFHALGVGTLIVEEMGDVTQHGALEVFGMLELYHLRNFWGENIEDPVNFPACPAL